ncbi:MAG: sodium:proton antiporter NhaD [Glaciecola sp.]|jgi:NhaD family Na+/H+ antiporter|nr:sodium:proton antiporter NhaD [Glaciecola sp.]MDG1468774.1 sodium:proton antiporter NhaD [Glaciecola sp.]MDG1922312.1 sodium:proton antiporter NhaD [Glaciecola sp.]
MFKLVFFAFLCCLAGPANAAQMGTLDLTYTLPGVIVLTIFVIAYVLVIGEEFLHIRKSKPMLLAAGIIWIVLGWIYTNHGMPIEAEEAFNHNLLEYAQLLLFLLVAMTYINAMEERGIFDRIRVWMLSKGMSLRSLFWLTGILAFLISSFANNLTTAMLMCAIVLKVAHDNPKFINIACINIVVAANAGGVFSPFGDITTLMIWQAGLVKFEQFIVLFVPAVVNFMVPALIMSLFISNSKNAPLVDHDITIKRGAKRIILLFFFTIATAVMCHSWLSMPPVLGMMLGLGYLQLLGFYLRFTLPKSLQKKRDIAERNKDEAALKKLGNIVPFDVFEKISRAEWDTLLFFYGVVMCVGGLGFMGYLAYVSEAMYTNWEPLYANILVGVLSAIIDNIPVVFAVLSMAPNMDLTQWLLVTMTAGVGGSLLSIGSAAGVALMGQTKGVYSFMGHMRWSWAIALGYGLSIYAHLLLNT